MTDYFSFHITNRLDDVYIFRVYEKHEDVTQHELGVQLPDCDVMLSTHNKQIISLDVGHTSNTFQLKAVISVHNSGECDSFF